MNKKEKEVSAALNKDNIMNAINSRLYDAITLYEIFLTNDNESSAAEQLSLKIKATAFKAKARADKLLKSLGMNIFDTKDVSTTDMIKSYLRSSLENSLKEAKKIKRNKK